MRVFRAVVFSLLALFAVSSAASPAARASDEPPPAEGKVVIEIRHCTTCGFRRAAEALAAEIREELGLESTLVVGKVGSFDVVMNGAVVFSRSETGRFPRQGEIVRLIRDRLSNTEREPAHCP